MLSSIIPNDKRIIVRLSDSYKKETKYEYENIKQFEQSYEWVLAQIDYELGSIKFKVKSVSIRYKKRSVFMRELIEKIEMWGIDRGLDNCNSVMQSTKTLEEVTELQQALINDNKLEIEDAIGDIFVTLIMICLQQDMNIEECIENAYQVIRNRKGCMVNGLWVKDVDEQ